MNASNTHPFGTNVEDNSTYHGSSSASECNVVLPLTQQPRATDGYPEPNYGEEGIKFTQVRPVVPVCPPGLEYLAMIDQVLVHQKIELLEVLCGCETRNKYDIKNSMGQVIYSAKEDSDCCTRNCLGPLRCFEMRIEDHVGREVITLRRDLRCMGCCCPCCLQEIEVYAPPDNLIGIVKEEWSICRPKYRVENAEGEVIFRVTGPICVLKCCSDIDFPIFAPNGVQIGKITKQWSGLIREAFTDADHFGITFPMDLDVNMKAALLGALFLIDFNYFEKKQ